MLKTLCNSLLALMVSLCAVSVSAQTISIMASTSTTICSGTAVTFAATTSGVGTPHYQWLKNSAHVGVDSAHYTTSTLATGDVIMCELLSAPGGTILALSGPIVMTVDNPPSPAAISGPATVCLGMTMTLTDATPGGVWASAHPLIASISAGGVVTGSSPGPDTISYTITNACGSASAVKRINVITPPTVPPITGPGNICQGATGTFMETDTTGTWSISTAGIASIGSTGIVMALSPGTDTVLYTVTNGCGSTVRRRPFNVLVPPVVAAIGGSSSVCENDTIHLTDATPGGSWRSSDNSIALAGPGPGGIGLVRGEGGGTAVITYLVFNACGGDSTTKTITVNPLPIVYPITGSRDSVCPGLVLTLNEYTIGGTWSSKNTSLATVDAAGNVTGVAAGIDTIFYSATNACGTVTQAYPLYVYCPSNVGVNNVSNTEKVSLYPNPTNDMVTVNGIKPAMIQVVNLYGQIVVTKSNTNTISLASLPGGVYYVAVFDEHGNVMVKQSVVKR